MNRPSIWSWRNAIRKSSLPPLAKLCCYVLADYMSDAGKGCFPSIVTLMKDTGLSNTSIARHLRLAVEAGLLVKHRFRDRAGHCAGTNYYPRFPERSDEEPGAEPATLGAAAFFEVPEAPETAKIEPAVRPARRSPWADYPSAESLSEPSRPDEPQPVPALSSLTHNCPVEPSLPIRLMQTPTTCGVRPFAGIERGVGWRLSAARDAKQRSERVKRIEASIEAERELVEIGL